MKSKSYVKISVLVLTIGVLASCSTDSEWKQYDLKGKVKTYAEHYYNVEKQSGEWVKGDVEIGVQTRMSFDSHGKYQSIERYNSENMLLLKSVPIRENGVVIGEEQYDTNGKQIYTSKITYTSKDVTEGINYTMDGTISSKGRTYLSYDKGKLKIKTIEVSGSENYSFVHEYDKDGNVISQKQKDKNGKVVNYQKYEYLAFDKHKNWTKRLTYEPETSEEPVQIAIREYQYF